LKKETREIIRPIGPRFAVGRNAHQDGQALAHDFGLVRCGDAISAHTVPQLACEELGSHLYAGTGEVQVAVMVHVKLGRAICRLFD